MKVCQASGSYFSEFRKALAAIARIHHPKGIVRDGCGAWLSLLRIGYGRRAVAASGDGLGGGAVID